MPIGLGAAAGISAGGSLLGGLFGGKGAKQAADTQAQAAEISAANTMQMFQQTQQNLAPYRALGASAAGVEGYLLGLPGYQNALAGPQATPSGAPAAAGGAFAPGAPAGAPASLPANMASFVTNQGGTFTSNGFSIIPITPVTVSGSGDQGGEHTVDGAYQVFDPSGNFVGQAPSSLSLTQVAQAFGGGTPVSGGGGAPGGGAAAPATPSSYNGLGFGAATTPFQPTMAQLAATPGYQFTLGQGLQATQNAFAAQGLARSGPALKGAATFAEGLASTTYQQQFQNYWNQINNIMGLIGGATATGENASALTGSLGQNASQIAGNFATSGAAAQAAGTIGATNALTGALGSASSLPLTLSLLQNNLGGVTGGGVNFNTSPSSLGGNPFLGSG